MTDYLKIRFDRYDQVCVLAVDGEMDMDSSGTFTEFTQGVTEAMGPLPRRIVMDLSGLRFIDCCGARALAAMTGPAPGRPEVVVRSVRPAVQRVLDLLDLGLPGTGPDLPGPGPDRRGLADSATGKLVRKSRVARSHAERVMADSWQVARNLAATEEEIAATLSELAARRPNASHRLTTMSQDARSQANRIRAQARNAGAD